MSTDELELLLQPQDAIRRQAASKVKALRDVHIPRLDLWNYEPCSHHEVPDPNCEWRLCGGPPFRHQRTGTTWMYLAHKGILADDTGLGKSGEIIHLICLLKQKQQPARTLIVCLPGAIEGAWLRDFRRFAPRLVVEPAVGPRYERIERYAGAWDVLIIGAQMMLRDMRVLRELEFDLVVSDDLQPLLHTETQTARAFKEIALRTERAININATPLNLRLQDLYALAVPLGGRNEFGSLKAFERRYVRMEEIRELDVRNGRPVSRWVTTGYKHMDEFKVKFSPWYLRRTYDDVEDDVAIPKVAPPTEVWLDLHPRQRERYEEVQRGVVKLLRQMESGQMAEHQKYANAMTAFGYGAQVCSGLQNLGEPDGPGTSVKLDWLEEHITGEWADEKVVVFSQYKGLIRAMRDRFARHDIGMAIVWGDTPGDSKRKAAIRKEEEDKFWTDPKCRVAVGTSAIERSLNFQIARIVVNVDQLMNPQRMIQILGRIRRAGSRHQRVYPFSLLAADTQEDRYLSVLEQRAALADYVFDDRNPLYKQLSPMELLHLVRP
jgi:SNF2 family DNA or RNA helicase